MKLKAIKLKNFRGYQETTVIPIDECMTGIVGRNDYGKSTILDALAIFFEIDGVKSDKGDINCFTTDTTFEVICIFDSLPERIVIDETVETTLGDEFLLNEDGDLEIFKSYKKTTGKLYITGILCSHPNDDNTKDLLSLKLADLKKSNRSL